MKIPSPYFFFLLCSLSIINANCQIDNTAPQLLELPYISHLDESQRNFYVYLPKGYGQEPDKKWPVMLFLHGNGERGNGNDELPFTMAHGPIYEAWVQKRDLPFIIIQPQLQMHGFDSVPNNYYNTRDLETYPKRLADSIPPRDSAISPDFKMEGSLSSANFPYKSLGPPKGWETVEQDVLDMIKTVQTNYNTNPAQIYLTGLSYGGFGTWYLASKHPKLFAAIAPIVGWGHPDLMNPIAKAKIPIWCFAGGRDSVIEPQYFYPGLNRLENLNHPDVKFTIEADMGHDVWRRVYAGDDIYNWLLKQKN